MSQIRQGTCFVTQHSNRVVANTGVNWQNARVGDIFGVPQGHVFYKVAQVVAPEDSESGDKWELILASNFGSETVAFSEYVIHQDFDPILGIPLPRKGDVEIAAITSAALERLASMGAEGRLFEGVWTPDVSGDFPVDASGDMSAYSAKRSYWTVDTDYLTYAIGGRLVWNGGTTDDGNSWMYEPPSSSYVPDNSLTTEKYQAESITLEKTEIEIQESVALAKRNRYRGEFDPKDDTPSSTGLEVNDYFIASASGFTALAYFNKGDVARFTESGFVHEARHAESVTQQIMSFLSWKGTWDASNGSPPIPTLNDAWVITTSGTFAGITWGTGSIAVYGSDGWFKLDNETFVEGVWDPTSEDPPADMSGDVSTYRPFVSVWIVSKNGTHPENNETYGAQGLLLWNGGTDGDIDDFVYIEPLHAVYHVANMVVEEGTDLSGYFSGALALDVEDPEGIVFTAGPTIGVTPMGRVWFKASAGGNTGWVEVLIGSDLYLIGGTF